MGLPRSLLLRLACLIPLSVLAQLSAPVAHDSQIKQADSASKFRTRAADMDKDGDIQHEGPVPGAQRCGHHRLDLAWMTEATSSVYATPLITDLHADGRRDIIVPSFVHYLEVLEGPNGGQAVGWPAFHASSVHASPLLYDIDFDGVRDIMLSTYDGQVMFFKDTGEKLPEWLQVNRLRVRKDWFVGLDPKDPFDHSHPDVKDGDATETGGAGTVGKKLRQQEQQQTGSISPNAGSGSSGEDNDRAPTYTMGERVRRFVRQITEYRKKYGDAAADKLMQEASVTNAAFYQAVVATLAAANKTEGQAQAVSAQGAAAGSSPPSSSQSSPPSPLSNSSRRRLMAADGDAVATAGAGGGAATVETAGAGEAVSQEAAASFDLFEDDREALHDQYGDQYGALADGLNSDADAVAADLHFAEREREMAEFLQQQQGLEGGELAVDGLGEGGSLDGDGLGGDVGDGGLQDGTGALDSFLQRLQYDEFGDLEGLTTMVGSDVDEHGHAVDPRAADPDELDKDSYEHLYLGDYVPAAGSLARKYRQRGWNNEEFAQSAHPDASAGYVYVDPHIMTTPAIGDIDGDGHDELVVAVSYFYDREYYDDPDHAKDLKGIDIGKYVASGVAVFDLRTRSEKWVQHLDLSTDSTQYKAYAYSSPTLVDLNGDGKLEIVLGTSMGFLYVLDHKGGSLVGWPLQLGEVQAQPLVADINNDGDLEIFISDMKGNLAAFSVKGEEVWERHVHSAVSQGAVAGDIDGDGQLEVVVGTTSGYIYALAGSTGADIPNWPYRARGRVQAAATITHLIEGTGMQVVVPAFDGFLYIIDGLQGCADVADMGETSYAAVLADDIDGDGALELVATTMNGNVYAFETGAKYHPLKTWTSQVLGPNGQVARYGCVGIYASPASRAARDVAGERLQIQFEVLDKRVAFADNGTLLPGGRGPYNVTVVLKGVGVREMGAGDAPVVGVADSFPGPGRYSVDIPCPKSQASAVVRLEMTDSSGLQYSDEFALSFHMHFHRLLKWVIALPLGLMLAVLLAAMGPTRSHAA